MRYQAKMRILLTLLAVLAVPGRVGAQDFAADLSRLVIVGDSISAGHQSSCLEESQQPNSFAVFLAEQAGVTMPLPLIEGPSSGKAGFPPCLVLLNPFVPVVVRNTALEPGGRIDGTVATTNLSVPGARAQDALDPAPDNSFHSAFGFPFDILHGLVLAGHPAGMSQVDLAESLDPTTVVIWLGANDVLWAMIGADARFITPANEFKKAYREVMRRLAATGATLVTADIPDITVIPFLTPADEFAAKFGVSLELLGLKDGDFVTTLTASPLVAGGFPGPLPNGDFCVPLGGGEVCDVVLDRDDAKAIRDATELFNEFIEDEAEKHGAAFVKANALLDVVDQMGFPVGAATITTGYLGGVFSFDGIHPSDTAHAVLANAFIAALNKEFGAGIDPLSDEDIADIHANDPFNPVNVFAP